MAVIDLIINNLDYFFFETETSIKFLLSIFKF